MGTGDIDFVILNRARSSLVYNVLRTGRPLIIRNKKLYLHLLHKVSYEAIEGWEFVAVLWRISQKVKSLDPEEKACLLAYLNFWKKELREIEELKKFNWADYLPDSLKRKSGGKLG